MTMIIGVIALTAFFAGAAWFIVARDALNKPALKNQQGHIAIWALLLIGLIIRIICAISYKGHETDMGCFSGWSSRIFNEGLGSFYKSGFHDYPPGYVYVMYVLGALREWFSAAGSTEWLILKMPSILADLGIGYFIYHIARKKYDNSNAAMLSAFFVLNPVIILNSCLWGQVDSVLTIFCILSVYFADERRFGASFFAFAAAFLIKPQAAFFAPVIIFILVDYIFMENGFDSKRLLDAAWKALAAIAVMFVLFMPFGDNPFDGIATIVKQYIETLGQYSYFTINAFNVYGIFDGNWAELTPGMSIFGYFMIAVVVAFAGFIYFKSKSCAKTYLSAAIIVFGVFMLSVKMHERYAFPAIAILMIALVKAPTTKNFINYAVFSLLQFFNIAWVLFIYETDPGAHFRSDTFVFASIINVAFFAWMMWGYYKGLKEIEVVAVSKNKKPVKKMVSEKKDIKPARIQRSEVIKKITVIDLVAIMVISVLYGCLAFYNLGNKYAPETETVITNNPVMVDFGEEKQVSELAFYLGARHLYNERNLTFTFFDNNNRQVHQEVYTDGSVFVWNHKNINTVNARSVKISTNHTGSETDPSDLVFVREVALMDPNGDLIPVDKISRESDVALFDEQDYFSEKDYMAGTYFDEIYHPRTAYEFLNGMSVYEWTHPPLGKVLMSIGVSIFGMVPFGWRFVGTLFGVFMIGVIYMFIKRMFKHTWLTSALTLLFTFDFMHFTQTRLATIDTYIVFFIMLMYYYMYKYYKMSFYDTPLKKTFVPLALSGIFFGLGVASKWTGMYAGAGLAVVFFITLWRRYKEYKYALKIPRGETDGIEHRIIIDNFKNNTVRTLAFCCIAFVAVPFIIYTLSYIPYMMTPSGDGLATIFNNAESMLTYHGRTVADSTHPYSSYWYEWPLMYKPMYYFSNTLPDGMKQGISAFGNPAVWWLGIGALAYTVAVAVIIPLREKKYFGKGKMFVGVIYSTAVLFLVLMSYLTSMDNDKLERFFPYMMIYGVIFVGIFLAVLANEEKLNKVSAKTALFLVIGFFAQLLPWVFVLRTTYIYHYFTCIPFVVLMIGFVIKTIYDNTENKKAVIIGTAIYVAIAIALFAMFYPVLSGAPVSPDYVDKYLRWMKSWVLVS